MTVQWSKFGTYRQDFVVMYNGQKYKNTTGLNSIPSNGLDWVEVDKNYDFRVNSVAELKNVVGIKEGDIVNLLGYYKAGDKEPLNYKWTTSQGVDDGGSVINSGNGSWLAVFDSEVVNILHFGLRSNEDATQVFLNADKLKNIYVPKLDGITILGNNVFTAKYVGDNTIVKYNNYDNILTNFPIQIINKTKSNLVFTGSGLNDLVINGEYQLINGTSIIVQIKEINVLSNDGITTDTFKYSLDGGITWTEDDLTINPIDDSETLLPLYCKDKDWSIGYSGLKINFAANTGHTVGNKWTFDAFQKSDNVNYRGFLKHENDIFLSFQSSGGIVFGKNSGSGNNISAGSTIFGSNSFKNNIKGYSNVGIGNYVLVENKTGALNVAIGDYALHRNISGQDNVAIGVYSMFDNVSGYGNACLGQDAMRYNVSGYYCTAMGAQSLYFNNGIGNTGVGNSAVRGNKNGISNTGIGKYSLLVNENGSSNSAVGAESFYHLNGGNNNTALGESSGFLLETGNDNTFIGRFTGVNALQKKDVNNSTALGCNSYTDKDNQVVIGDDRVTEVIIRSANASLGSANNKIKLIYAKKAIISDLSVFENNTDARNSGVGVGEVYRTSTGVLMVGF